MLCAGRAAQSMSAMVTSTSTPGSIEMEVICLTISDGECRSMRRLWMRISNRSQVLVPSPQGDLRVVMRSVLVGSRTGPLTLSRLSLAPLMRSAQTMDPGGGGGGGEHATICEGATHICARRGGSGLRALLEVLDVAAGQGDPDAVDLDSCVVLELLRLHGGCVLREEDAALSDGGGGAKGEPAPEGRGVESEGDGAESCPPPGKGAGPLLGGGAPPSMPWWARVLRTATLTEATRSNRKETAAHVATLVASGHPRLAPSDSSTQCALAEPEVRYLSMGP